MAEVFESKLRKVGNSVGIIIPNDILDELGYDQGDVIQVAIPPSDFESRNEIIHQMAGSAKGKKPFKREKRDRY